MKYHKLLVEGKKMKHTLGVLSLCFLATWTSAPDHPLCSIDTLFINETSVLQTISGLIHGERRGLECIAGCGLYIVNQTGGHIIRHFAGPGYFMFETCIKKGVHKANTCTITDCVLDLILTSLKLAKAIGMDIPFLDPIERLIEFMKSKHTSEETFTGQQLAAMQDHVRTSPPTTELLEPELSDISTATSTSLHISGYLLLFLAISYI